MKKILQRLNKLCGDYLLLILVTCFFVSALAAPRVERLINSIVIRVDQNFDEVAGTNGHIRGYGPGGTSYWARLTNGQQTYFAAGVLVTGFTGFNIQTNPAGGGYISNGWVNGLMFCTNCPGATLPGNLL